MCVKTMESSTVVAFRALVMLACLIVVPLAAILGSAFPEVVRSIVLEKLGHKPTQTASHPGAEASRFGQFGPAPAFPPSSSQSPWNNSPQPNAGPAPTWPTSAPSLSINAGGSNIQSAPTSPGYKPADVPPQFAAPAEQVPPNVSPQSGNQSPFHHPYQTQTVAAPDNPPVKQAGGPLHEPSSVVQIPATAGGSVIPVNSEARPTPQGPGGSPQAQQPDRFSWIEKRLRDYGATYYRLETWGDAGEFYRFHCKMAVGNNPNYTQQFEATDGDALRAMTQVLEQVEAWRGRMN